jgi:hypothetical protein
MNQVIQPKKRILPTQPDSQKVSNSIQLEPNELRKLEKWKPYSFDHYAQSLVIKYRDQKDVLNETHKMRMTIAYGLERFWGEPLRLEKESQPKANYWKDVWKTLLEEFLQPSGLGTKLPSTYSSSTEKIQETIQLIWDMDQEEREISQMILTQFCDSLVWWSQRLKIKKSK